MDLDFSFCNFQWTLLCIVIPVLMFSLWTISNSTKCKQYEHFVRNKLSPWSTFNLGLLLITFKQLGPDPFFHSLTVLISIHFAFIAELLISVMCDHKKLSIEIANLCHVWPQQIEYWNIFNSQYYQINQVEKDGCYHFKELKLNCYN